MEEESNTLMERLLQEKDEEVQTRIATDGGKDDAPTSPMVDAEAVPVPSPVDYGLGTGDGLISSSNEANQTWQKGEKQEPKYRDLPYGIAFHIQFFTIFALAIYYGPKVKEALFDDDSDGSNVELTKFVTMIGLSASLALASSMVFNALSFFILTKFGTAFIKISVWSGAVINLIFALLLFSAGQPIAGALFAFSALMCALYAWTVRRRIPFAASLLNAGVKAIRNNVGIFFISLISGALMFGWSYLWIVSLLGITGAQKVCPDDENMSNGEDSDVCTVQLAQGGWILPWILFLFWTQQVMKNVIHTTVAGIVSTWYFDPPNAQGCCSAAVRDSTKRSLTTSFGSICLGSLLVAIIQTLDYVVQNLRRNSENNEQSGGVALLLCCLDCILQCLESIMEYFNKWAFIYVGVYGYPYVEAGKKVMTLFSERGWTVVINDNLVSGALGLMSFTIALLISASSTVLISTRDEWGIFFTLIFALAFVLSLTMMSAIDSAVSTVIVCFAEAPSDLERNHQAHYREIREAWNKVYPLIRF